MLKRLLDRIFLSPKNWEWPISQATLDRLHKEGNWDSLDSIGEVAPCAVIAGYVHYLFASPTILDVGCGRGRLLKLLNTTSLNSYLGIDLSVEAIRQAGSLAIEKAAFEVANLEEWNPTERFDAIIFTDSLCYAQEHPANVLLRYAQALNEGGAFIVSIYRYGNHRMLWKNIEKHFVAIDATTVKNRKRQVWDIKALRQRWAE